MDNARQFFGTACRSWARTCLGRDLRVTGYHDDAAIVTALWDGDEVKLPNAIDKVTGRRITS